MGNPVAFFLLIAETTILEYPESREEEEEEHNIILENMIDICWKYRLNIYHDTTYSCVHIYKHTKNEG